MCRTYIAIHKCREFLNASLQVVHEWNSLVISRRYLFGRHLCIFQLFNSLCPLFHNVLSVLERVIKSIELGPTMPPRPCLLSFISSVYHLPSSANFFLFSLLFLLLLLFLSFSPTPHLLLNSWNKVSLNMRSDWPWTQDTPVSASRGQEWQEYTTISFLPYPSQNKVLMEIFLFTTKYQVINGYAFVYYHWLA